MKNYTINYMDESDIRQVLTLSRNAYQMDVDILFDAFHSSFALGTNFFQRYCSEIRKLPYHINVIDLLRAKENAHSRILKEILKYHSENTYPFFESFLNSVGFGDIKVEYPKFKTEEGRIDLSVIDKEGGYVLIIENKINYAPDRENQIERYIEAVKNKGFSEDHIYVIYLSNSGGGPKEYSLSPETKYSLGNRYKEISYRYEVTAWLKEEITPKVLENDIFLNSALQQYLDHLNGKFNQRENQKEMNKELIAFLEQELEVQENTNSSIETIKFTINKIEKTKQYLDQLLKLKWLRYWEEKMREEFSSHSFVEFAIDYEDISEYPFVGLMINFGNLEIWIGIEYAGSPVYGVSQTEDVDKKPRIESLLKKILRDFKQKDEWYGYKESTPDAVYDKFSELANRVIETIISKTRVGEPS